MTDNEFSSHFDANEIIRKATRRIADQTESVLRDAVAVELRRQGWTVVPPGEAHTATDDERESLRITRLDARQAAYRKEREDWFVDHEAEPEIASNAFFRGWDAAVAEGFRRSEVPEPSAEDEFAPGECDGSGTCAAPRHIHGCYTPHRADQCDAPEEYGHLSAQGEPSDAQANAAARAIMEHDEETLVCYDHPEDFCCPCGEHGMSRSEWLRHQARAALRAGGVQGEPSDAQVHADHAFVQTGAVLTFECSCGTGRSEVVTVDLPQQVDAVAAAIAQAADADYWTDEIAAWEGAEAWEREAHPDNYPGMAYEDREAFRKQARAAVHAIAPQEGISA